MVEIAVIAALGLLADPLSTAIASTIPVLIKILFMTHPAVCEPIL